MIKIKEAIDKLNTLDFEIEDLQHLMNLSTLNTVWGVNLTNDALLSWSKENNKLILIIDNIEYDILFDKTFQVYTIKDLDIEDCFYKSKVELYLDVLSDRLCAYPIYLDDDNHWRIDTGEKGWFAFKNGQYVVGSYGTITPNKIMNDLCSFEVTNLNTENYRWDDKNPPFVAKI